MPTPALPAWHQHRRLADLHDTGIYAHCAEPLELARKWVAKFRSDEPLRRGLYLHGPVGAGKTSIAAAIAVEVEALYWDTRALLAAMKEEFGLGRVAYPVKERCVRVPVLVLDDIGKQRRTDWVVEETQDIVERRFDRGGLTVVTSNLGPGEMASFVGAAAWSRLQAMCAPVEVDGPDLRRGAA